MTTTDTIVALSTPPGRGAIAVVRLSGSRSLELAQRIVRDDQFFPKPGQVGLRYLRNPANGEILDQALVTYFRSPGSFTGEDQVEFSCHGSPAVVELLLEAMLKLDARLAAPGEFTLRALGNGRISLSQAEAIRDLIDAQTGAAVRQASRQLRGEISQRLQPVKERLLEIIVPLESSIEFVEDDLPATATEVLKRKLADLCFEIEKLADTFAAGRVLKEGLRVALVGTPNAGKSSLFNRLLSYERAIVTEIPGTTRDSLTEPVNIEGVPVWFTDTAGLRQGGDSIESIGIERTRRVAADADLVVLVIDGSRQPGVEDEKPLGETNRGLTVVAVNKCDLASFDENTKELRTRMPQAVSISAKTGHGIDVLKTAILSPFITAGWADDGLLITNARHHDLLRRTAVALQSSSELLTEGTSEELVIVGLYNALRLLGELTGETTPDDVLGQIFSTFCIGK
ncbi:MAG: tRNA uridine-5-carboxymethylaminomethyl(34) synthesis GTPase MnmE [Pyrinomonadaceae bacterium]